MNRGTLALDSISLLDRTLDTVEENLALDEALLIEAPERGAVGVLRFWEFGRLAVILGASRRIAEDVNQDHCQADQVPILRRSSGGGTVVIGAGALNVTLILPETAAPELATVSGAQHFVLEPIARSLSTPSLPVQILGLGDLCVNGRKFAGSAQRRVRDCVLVHFSLLYDFPLQSISRYLAVPARQPSYRAGRSHKDFLMNLPRPRRIIENLICDAWSPAPKRSPTTDAPQPTLERLLAEKFANRSWIERL